MVLLELLDDDLLLDLFGVPPHVEPVVEGHRAGPLPGAGPVPVVRLREVVLVARLLHVQHRVVHLVEING